MNTRSKSTLHPLGHLVAVSQLHTLDQLRCRLPLAPFDLSAAVEATRGAGHDLDV